MAVMEKEEQASSPINSYRVNYKKDWIFYSRCFSYMTGDKDKFHNISEYRGRRVVTTANNAKLLIIHVGNIVIDSYHN